MLLRCCSRLDGHLSVHPSGDFVANAGHGCIQAIKLAEQFGEQELMMRLDHSDERFLKSRQFRPHLSLREMRQLDGIGFPCQSCLQHRTS